MVTLSRVAISGPEAYERPMNLAALCACPFLGLELLVLEIHLLPELLARDKSSVCSCCPS
jgi:hypothetical protein